MGAEFSQEVLHITAGSVERRFDDIQNKVMFHWIFVELTLMRFDIFSKKIFDTSYISNRVPDFKTHGADFQTKIENNRFAT